MNVEPAIAGFLGPGRITLGTHQVFLVGWLGIAGRPGEAIFEHDPYYAITHHEQTASALW